MLGCSLSVSVVLQGCLLTGETETTYQMITYKLPLVLQGSQCGDNQDGLSADLVSGRENIEKIFKKFRTNQQLRSLTEDSRALWVRAGQKPSAGYKLKVNPEAHLSNHRLSLWVDESAPPKGMRIAQVITSPCSLVVLPSADYDVVQLQGELSHLPMKIKVQWADIIHSLHWYFEHLCHQYLQHPNNIMPIL